MPHMNNYGYTISLFFGPFERTLTRFDICSINNWTLMLRNLYISAAICRILTQVPQVFFVFIFLLFFFLFSWMLVHSRRMFVCFISRFERLAQRTWESFHLTSVTHRVNKSCLLGIICYWELPDKKEPGKQKNRRAKAEIKFLSTGNDKTHGY